MITTSQLKSIVIKYIDNFLFVLRLKFFLKSMFVLFFSFNYVFSVYALLMQTVLYYTE